VSDFPAVPGFTATRLSADDAPALQDLFERAPDYFELCEGGPAHADAALTELTRVPEFATAADLVTFGFRREEALDAVVVLLRDSRVEATWWIGLLLLAPPVRRSGLGTLIVDATREWLASQGAKSIYIGVVTANDAALRFWRARGFEDKGVQPFTTAYGFATEVVVMRLGV